VPGIPEHEHPFGNESVLSFLPWPEVTFMDHDHGGDRYRRDVSDAGRFTSAPHDVPLAVNATAGIRARTGCRGQEPLAEHHGGWVFKAGPRSQEFKAP